MRKLIDQLRAALIRDGAGLTDGQLLSSFIATRESFANVYFGTGDNVPRKKPW